MTLRPKYLQTLSFDRKIRLFSAAGFLLFLALLASLLVFTVSTQAEDWQNLVQPVGTLTAVEPAAVVNARLGGTPPFDTATDVTTIHTTTMQYFVRFYNPTDPVNPSQAVGSWIMRAATVRGLTPAQVRDIFALPSMPAYFTMVRVPSGYNVYTGIAAPIAGWGDGGAQQSKLIGPPWVDAANFFNRQAVTSCIFCYRSQAMNRNTASIGAYLDRRIPAAYSDLENVYLNLDMLYNPATASAFNSALEQIGPGRYDSLTNDNLSAGGIVNDAIDERVFAAVTREKISAPAAGLMFAGKIVTLKGSNEENGCSMWASAAGAIQRAADLGYNGSTTGLILGVEKQGNDLLAGFSLAVLESNLEWTSPGGNASSNRLKAGVYGAGFLENLFIQGGLNAGINRTEARRNIVFSDISKSAHANIDGLDFNARLRCGYKLPITSLDIIPNAGLDYFYLFTNDFNEEGADSLNLNVSRNRSQFLRSYLGLHVSKSLSLQKGFLIKPLLEVGWMHDHALTGRTLTAGLSGQPDEFSIDGQEKESDNLVCKAGITLNVNKNLMLLTNYGLRYRSAVKEHTFVLGLNYLF